MPLLDGLKRDALERAARALAAGELVAFPTETVYGLGARADDGDAVARIFAAKGRPSEHPLIVHVIDLEAATAFASTIDDSARRLAAAFWPGPVTVIVPRRAGVAEAAAGGQPGIGLRCPAHPVARALLREAAALGVPGVAAPSANRFGRISPTTAAHVVAEFGAALWVVDGGPCDVGIESAIVDCSRTRPVLLRPGVLTRTQLESALGEPLAMVDADAPRAPGMLEAHYAPRAPLRLVDAATLRAMVGSTRGVAVYSRTRPALAKGVVWRPMPSDPVAAAQQLFATLRELDVAQPRQIWVEWPPDTLPWEGVRDRLRRAAASVRTDRPGPGMDD